MDIWQKWTALAVWFNCLATSPEYNRNTTATTKNSRYNTKRHVAVWRISQRWLFLEYTSITCISSHRFSCKTSLFQLKTFIFISSWLGSFLRRYTNFCRPREKLWMMVISLYVMMMLLIFMSFQLSKNLFARSVLCRTSVFFLSKCSPLCNDMIKTYEMCACAREMHIFPQNRFALKTKVSVGMTSARWSKRWRWTEADEQRELSLFQYSWNCRSYSKLVEVYKRRRKMLD